MTGKIYTKEQAKASDRRLAELQEAALRAELALMNSEAQVHRAAGSKKLEARWAGQKRSSSFWSQSFDEAYDKASALAAGSSEDRPRAERAVAAYDAARTEQQDTDQAVEEHSREWQEHGRWSRFIMVQGGHIHSSPRCHTIRRSTRYGWLPDLSGETEADAVAAHGPRLCTHCFPTAPVEWTIGVKKDPDQCPAEGYKKDTWRRYGPYGNGLAICTSCGTEQTITQTGKVRKHKRSPDA